MLGSRKKRWQQILLFLGFGLLLVPSQYRYLNFDLTIDQNSDTIDKPLTAEIFNSFICQPYLRRVLVNLCQQDFSVVNGVKNCLF